ncbi:MAG: hypothetical protein M3017_09555 [Actinomycetota bacterium]|nr:hypothetical protein [Actinomycetota bacterium]
MSTEAGEKDHQGEGEGQETGQGVPPGDKGVGLGPGQETTTFETEEDPEAELGHS